MWTSLGLLTVYPDRWVSTIGITNSSLIRITWLKGDAPLKDIHSRFLIRRKIISGEVGIAQTIYASDEPLIINFIDLETSYSIQVKKLMRHRPLTREPFYQLLVEYFSE